MTGSLRSVLIKLGLFTAITLSLTGLLAAVIGNYQPFTRFYQIDAEFSDATGLLAKDVVKVAGVTVGKVKSSQLEFDEKTGKAHALVTLSVKTNVHIPTNARASIRFRNLLGQRMIVLSRNGVQPDAKDFAHDGRGTIPRSRTTPAFDLGIVFNNLRPVLANLRASDVNTVSESIVKIFSGREERLQTMTRQLADVTQSLGSHGPALTGLITNLAEVAQTVADHDAELGSIVDSLDKVVGTLGNRSTELARAAENIGVAGTGTAKILADNRPDLDTSIHQLSVILGMVADQRNDLDRALHYLPDATEALLRATTYGKWVNLNGVCIQGLCGAGFETEPGITPLSKASKSTALDLIAQAYGGER